MGQGKGHLWVADRTAGADFSVSTGFSRPAQWRAWSFKVLARAGSLLGGRPPGAEMAQAFQGPKELFLVARADSQSC